MVVDFTFNNSAGTTTFAANISQPAAWGSGDQTISTSGTTWSYRSYRSHRSYSTESTESDAGDTADAMACWTGRVLMAEDPSIPLIRQ